MFFFRLFHKNAIFFCKKNIFHCNALKIVFCNQHTPIITVTAAFCHADADVVAVAPKIVDAEQMSAVSGGFVACAAIVDKKLYGFLASSGAYGYALKIIEAAIAVPIGAERVSGGVYLDVHAVAVGIHMRGIIAFCHVLSLCLSHLGKCAVPL